MIEKFAQLINKLNDVDQLEGVTFSSRPIANIVFCIRFCIETITYKIVGSDKFTKWLWLHDFFERWH